MKYTWERAFADGREAALVGEGSERMLDAYRKLLFDGAQPAAFIEAPLLGRSGYDVVMILQGDRCYPGCKLHNETQTQAQAMIDWVAGLENTRPDMFFEFDASGSGKLAGVHCKIEGRLELAESFFNALGEPQRTASFIGTAERLPEGWICLYAAAFPGRQISTTRMEILIFGKEARRLVGDAEYLKECFEHLGYRAYDGQMLREAAQIAAIGVPVTMQFDLGSDGSISPCFSLLSNYEHARSNFRQLFGENGALNRTCRIYEKMGIADERWQLIEKSCFAVKCTLLTAEGIADRVNRCLPCCTKVKWKSPDRRAAKFYLMLDSQRVD